MKLATEYVQEYHSGKQGYMMLTGMLDWAEDYVDTVIPHFKETSKRKYEANFIAYLLSWVETVSKEPPTKGKAEALYLLLEPFLEKKSNAE